jgi:hypothetical protein
MAQDGEDYNRIAAATAMIMPMEITNFKTIKLLVRCRKLRPKRRRVP